MVFCPETRHWTIQSSCCNLLVSSWPRGSGTLAEYLSNIYSKMEGSDTTVSHQVTSFHRSEAAEGPTGVPQSCFWFSSGESHSDKLVAICMRVRRGSSPIEFLPLPQTRKQQKMSFCGIKKKLLCMLIFFVMLIFGIIPNNLGDYLATDPRLIPWSCCPAVSPVLHKKGHTISLLWVSPACRT